MRFIESLLANLNRESRLAKYIESAQLYDRVLKSKHIHRLTVASWHRRKGYQTKPNLYSLEAVEECVDVPKEICNMVQVNPRTVRTPTVKKWCGPAELVGSGT